jgi:hypothetical protein
MSEHAQKGRQISRGEHIERAEELGTDLERVVQSLTGQAGNRARLLECYYWSQEPGLLEPTHPPSTRIVGVFL